MRLARQAVGDLTQIALTLRREVVGMSFKARAPHLASALSCIDILTAAYWGVLRIDPQHPRDPARDRLVFSKGHAASALYAVLAHRGFFPVKELESFGRHGGRLAEQPIPFAVPGVEAATGSLGHGLSLGVGMALAGRIKKIDHRVVVVMGDGECNEGSVWEAAMFAPSAKLANLTVVVDYNKWQGTGRSQDILSLSPLREKWQSFGWHGVEVDGHDIAGLIDALWLQQDDQPVAIIAHTTKGRGVSFMEDDNNWHYRVPDERECQMAIQELEKA
ncbi:MAG: transketolase [Phycisphaera sp.]|nr:transketolase [Phycisphaera sp.]